MTSRAQTAHPVPVTPSHRQRAQRAMRWPRHAFPFPLPQMQHGGPLSGSAVSHATSKAALVALSEPAAVIVSGMRVRLLILRPLSNERLGGEHQASHARRILQRRPNHLDRIDYALSN